MKRIELNDNNLFKARDVLIGMLESPTSAQGITYAEMRKRDRLLDAMDKHKGSYIDLEDADHEVLMQIINTSQFLTAKRELRKILDDFANPKEPVNV